MDAGPRQYRLRPGSPVQDAGTSAGAPPTDAEGSPRFDDPNVVGRGDGTGYDPGAFEAQQGAVADVDLLAADVTGPASAANGAVVTVNWTVRNVGSGPAVGPWSDAVYVSDEPVWTPRATFLGRVTHAGDLGAGLGYAAAAAVTVRGLLPGPNYFLVRANDRGDVFEGLAAANNAAASAAPVAAPVATLAAEVPFADSFGGAGKYYRVTVPAGRTLELSLDSAAAGGGTELYVARGRLPSPDDTDFAAVAAAPDQRVVVPATEPGSYFVLARPGYCRPGRAGRCRSASVRPCR